MGERHCDVAAASKYLVACVCQSIPLWDETGCPHLANMAWHGKGKARAKQTDLTRQTSIYHARRRLFLYRRADACHANFLRPSSPLSYLPIFLQKLTRHSFPPTV